MKYSALIFSLLGLSITAFAQMSQTASKQEPNVYAEADAIYISKTEQSIVLDGVLDESAWFKNPSATDFWQWFPTDTLLAEQQSEIYFTYDEQYLYVGIKCYAKGNDYVVPSLKRDFRAGGNDNISILFDTFNDETNAFLFGLNPKGVRREALVSGGGLELNGFSTSWDNKWLGEAKVHDGFWVSEFAIPFSTLRFKEGGTKWRFNCYRFDTQSNENTTLTQIPQNQWIFNLAYMKDMIWDEPLKKPGTNISIIPYAIGNSLRDFEAGDDKATFEGDFGGDAKIGITSGLNLDLTVNPDFSQVEVDRQVLDLNRFEIFFPERRQFFVENADLFGSFGMSQINPFFSRRIGIDGEGGTIPILYGARLSGKLTDDWRVGLLNMQTQKDEGLDIPSFNYSVAALQRKVFARSNIGMIFVNKQAGSGDIGENFNEYNRLIGLDYNIASRDNSWTGKVFYHQVLSPVDTVDQKFSQGVEISYTTRKFMLEWLHQYVSDGFDPEVGFVPRKDFFRINPQFQLFFYPNGNLFNQHGPSLELSMLYKPEFGRSDHQLDLAWEFDFSNSARGSIGIRNAYTYLFKEFDPTGISDVVLAPENGYNYTTLQVTYNSDQRKKLSFFVSPVIGEFYNGYRLTGNGNVSYRFQHFGSFSVNFSYNYLKPDDHFEPVSLFLVGPRIDLTFTKKIFLTTFFQYNNQSENFNINARLQWRFQPVSDFFLVYTDNYATENFGVKNRAIVAKITYWLNL